MGSLIIGIILLAVISIGMFLLEERRCHRLSKSLQESLDKEEKARRREIVYEAMLPGKLLGIFQKGQWDKLRIGEENSVKAAVLSYNVPGFAKIVREQSAEGIFNFVNGILSHVVPCVLYQEGEIDKYVNAGLSAFFLNAPERALRSAVSICEALNQAGVQEAYSIGLDYGDIMVGVVGHEKRFGTLTISETTGLAEFLQELAVRYKARILITGGLKAQIPDFEKHYNSRYLGSIYLKAARTAEEIYDVYDGDDPTDKNGKRKTRLLFEKGVALFQDEKFHDARQHFIEILKANRMDGAAKEYLYLCNRYCSEDAPKDKPTYLDVY